MGFYLLMIGDKGHTKKGSNPIASASNMGKNLCQHSGGSSWVGMAGYMVKSTQARRSANEYGAER